LSRLETERGVISNGGKKGKDAKRGENMRKYNLDKPKKRVIISGKFILLNKILSKVSFHEKGRSRG